MSKYQDQISSDMIGNYYSRLLSMQAIAMTKTQFNHYCLLKKIEVEIKFPEKTLKPVYLQSNFFTKKQ